MCRVYCHSSDRLLLDAEKLVTIKICCFSSKHFYSDITLIVTLGYLILLLPW